MSTATKKKGETSVAEAADPGAPIGRRRNVTPVTRTKEIDTRGIKAGQDHVAQIALEGPAEITRDDIESVVPGPGFKDLAEQLKFNEDILTIIIAHDDAEFPEDPVMVAVNGRQCFIHRGEPMMVKRKYVERLCRAKPNNIRQDLSKFRSNPDENSVNRLQITARQRYPFSLLQDPNTKQGGLPWLQKLMAEP